MRKADVHCSFCDLIHGAGEASICYEDSDALAFMDIQPVNPGHVLVVPRQHHESLVDTPPELAMHLFKVSTQLANVIRTCDGRIGRSLSHKRSISRVTPSIRRTSPSCEAGVRPAIVCQRVVPGYRPPQRDTEANERQESA